VGAALQQTDIAEVLQLLAQTSWHGDQQRFQLVGRSRASMNQTIFGAFKQSQHLNGAISRFGFCGGSSNQQEACRLFGAFKRMHQGTLKPE